MISLKRIIRDYEEAGALNSALPVFGFVDEHVFITKASELGLAFRLTGIDYEGCDVAQRQDIVHRFEAAMRLLGEPCWMYEYLMKRRIDALLPGACANPIAAVAIQRRTDFLNDRKEDLYELDLYLVIVADGLSAPSASTKLQHLLRDPKRALTEWLTGATAVSVLEEEIQQAVARLHHLAAAFQVQLADSVKPVLLFKSEVFTFLRRLVNYAPHKVFGAPLRYDTHVDYFLADSAVECHRGHLDVDDYHVKVLSMKEPPGHTFAHMQEDLYGVPGEFIACLEWRRIPTGTMRRQLKKRQRHFFQKRTSLLSHVSTEEPRPDSQMLVDASADATVHQLGDALTQMETQGHVFGECSLTVVLYDQDMRKVDRASAGVIKALAAHDGVFIEETYNLLNAWLSILPGNHHRNLRRLAMLDVNCADLSFLFTLDRGQAQSEYLGREALAVFETRTGTPYALNLHVEDVGHTLVVGKTGGGKSVLMNMVATMVQRYDPFTAIFDFGGSYQKLARLLKGSYLEMGVSGQGVRMNPFAIAPTRDNLHFLLGFTKVLMEGRGHTPLTEGEASDVYAAIENLYTIPDPALRRLSTVGNMVHPSLRPRLAKWMVDGRYGEWFDNEADTLTVANLQVFEFQAMKDHRELLEPMLFYILHRVGERILSGPGLKLCFMDEVWQFVLNPTLRAYVQEGLKTWRKKNAVMVLATQGVQDFAAPATDGVSAVDLLRTVIESCPTKIFLAMESIDRAQTGTLFHLNEKELDLLAGLQGPRQLLLKRADLAKVLTLNLDPTSYWIYTNKAADNAKFNAAVERYGFDEGLARLAAAVA